MRSTDALLATLLAAVACEPEQQSPKLGSSLDRIHLGAALHVSKQARVPPAKTMVYTHPLGVRFRYPQGWKVTAARDGILTLAPPDALRNADGTLELYFVAGDSAAGLKSATDPEVGRTLDKLMQVLPFMKRKGETEPRVLDGRRCTEYRWSGINPKHVSFDGRAWASIVEGFAVAVVGVAPPEQLAKRSPLLRAIASSFHFEAPPIDRNLTGNWSNENHYSSGSGYSGTIAHYLQLRTDGTCYSSDRAFALVRTSDAKGNYGGTFLRDTGVPEGATRGRWTTHGGQLRLTWDGGGTEVYSYEHSADSLLLISRADGKKQLWSR